MDSTQTTLLIVLAALAAYPLLLWRLSKFVEPARLEMGELGERLLQDEFITDKQKGGIAAVLDGAYSGWTMMLWVIAMFAIIALCIPMNVLKILRRTPAKMITHHKETEVDYDRFMTLSLLSAAAANPLFAFVFAFQLIMVIALMLVSFMPARMLRDLVSETFRWEAVFFGRTAALQS